jgi:hypothetical protein
MCDRRFYGYLHETWGRLGFDPLHVADGPQGRLATPLAVAQRPGLVPGTLSRAATYFTEVAKTYADVSTPDRRARLAWTYPSACRWDTRPGAGFGQTRSVRRRGNQDRRHSKASFALLLTAFFLLASLRPLLTRLGRVVDLLCAAARLHLPVLDHQHTSAAALLLSILFTTTSVLVVSWRWLIACETSATAPSGHRP